MTWLRQGTGEMGKHEVTREAFPLHYFIADRLQDAEVRPFDQYQGPYVYSSMLGRAWLGTDEKGDYVYAEREDLMFRGDFPEDAVERFIVWAEYNGYTHPEGQQRVQDWQEEQEEEERFKEKQEEDEFFWDNLKQPHFPWGDKPNTPEDLQTFDPQQRINDLLEQWRQVEDPEHKKQIERKIDRLKQARMNMWLRKEAVTERAGWEPYDAYPTQEMAEQYAKDLSETNPSWSIQVAEDVEAGGSNPWVLFVKERPQGKGPGGRGLHREMPVEEDGSSSKAFKVWGVSSNTNSFGLHGVLLIAKDGEVWEAAKYLSGHQEGSLKAGQTIHVTRDETGELDWSTLGFEVPKRKPDAGPEFVDKVWG